MKAKEMFEKLGYYEDTEHNSIFAIKVYQNNNDRYKPRIYFDNDKTICKDGIFGRLDITFEELQAINKQIEELGWNNE